jgi:probable rRNA maturation factor
VLRQVAQREGWDGDISVAVLDDAGISALNATFKGRDEPTDVLAFPYGDDADGLAGEIVVSAETAERVGASLDETPERELLRYCVHGLLHLCGYDDRTPAQRRRMEAVQEAALPRSEEFRA